MLSRHPFHSGDCLPFQIPYIRYKEIVINCNPVEIRIKNKFYATNVFHLFDKMDNHHIFLKDQRLDL